MESVKRHIFVVGIFYVAFLLSITSVSKPTPYKKATEIESFNYVVIGAFAFHNNAIRFTDHANTKGMTAEYALHVRKKLYFVYVLKTKDYKQARDEAYKLRETEEFYDTWVYYGDLGSTGETESVADDPGIVDSSTVPENNITETAVMEDTGDETDSTQTVPSGGIQITEEPTPAKPTISAGKGEYLLYFNTIGIEKFKEVYGKIEIIEPVRARKMGEYESHNLVKIKGPNSQNKNIKIATNIFGYRPVEHMINLDEPINDSTANFVEKSGDSIIVNFDLHRFKKGDIMVMYNVYFFKDAAIMKPESKYELNRLHDMLEENDNIKIRIHGHTNGNSHGKIIHLNTDDHDFFTLKAGNHKETVGSAKKLSEQRAYTIQHYLIDQGIPEARMEIRGWGGKKMIYGKHDTQAKKNVRVEIEILEE